MYKLQDPRCKWGMLYCFPSIEGERDEERKQDMEGDKKKRENTN